MPTELSPKVNLTPLLLPHLPFLFVGTPAVMANRSNNIAKTVNTL
jgi:hypothetical protein